LSLVKYLNSLKYEHKNKKIAVKLLNLHQILGLFMKKTTFITVLVAIMMMAVTPAFAQDENGFQKFNVREDFSENGFQWFHDAELLAAGDKEKSNAMTIGWGGIGTLWGRTALTVYVAEKRYTKEFMDKAEYFTVMVFDVKDSKVLNYMGTKSGRDGDKAQALGLHTAYTANGTPYYTEATMVIECKIMYAAPFDPQYFKSDAPKNMYANFPAGIHSMYIGEVVNAWKK
jgi:flavin reductase (DIM6/NTAB) family NADH-FMN oxidoreductase RutF